jgi:hypothetical protein
MMTGLLFSFVSGLGLALLRSTGWYDDADLVAGPLGTLGLVLLLKGLSKA